jgi:pimeloyl-ACP methyl ester carboxylesterase
LAYIPRTRFDKTYWDLPYNNFNYSYIDVAVDKYGYSTLSYDRFGIGNSSHADPYSVVQAPAEISALYQLNSMLRMGTLPTVNQTFDKSGTIVNVGHSFGSQQSYALAAMYPNVTDALILTGFSFNGSGLPATAVGFNAKIARYNQPLRFGNTNVASVFDTLAMPAKARRNSDSDLNTMDTLSALCRRAQGHLNILRSSELCNFVAGYDMKPAPIPQDYPTGYLTWSDAQNNQYNFFYPPGADTELLYYSEQNKHPCTVGELLTLGGAPTMSSFAGPVQVVTGRQDSVYCSGDCLATGDPAIPNIPAGIGKYLPHSSNFTTLIPEDVGHAFNLHYHAVAAYDQIQEFLMANDIFPS